MKKVILVFVAVLSFALISNNLQAQTKPATVKAVVKTEQTKTTSGNFTDKDKNGVCDKHEVKGGKANCDMHGSKDGSKCATKCKADAKTCGSDKGTAKACGDLKGNGCAKTCKH
jgi:hypothetical protein